MFKVESSTVINAPVGEVYDWIENPDKHHDWQHSLLECRSTEEGNLVVVRNMLGRRMETHFHEFERVPNKFTRRSGKSGPGMPVSYTIEQETQFEEVEGGTKVTITSQVDTKGLLKAALPVIARLAKQEQDSSLSCLKELVEAGPDLQEVLTQVPRCVEA
jgi:uncharacterized protein YndB with AHSA1/START domain